MAAIKVAKAYFIPYHIAILNGCSRRRYQVIVMIAAARSEGIPKSRRALTEKGNIDGYNPSDLVLDRWTESPSNIPNKNRLARSGPKLTYISKLSMSKRWN